MHVLLPWGAQMLSLLDGMAGDALLPTLKVPQPRCPTYQGLAVKQSLSCGPHQRHVGFGCTLSVSSRPSVDLLGVVVALIERSCTYPMIAQALAGRYKQSLYFAFRLSRQHYGEAGERRATVLEPLLVDGALERFASELHALVLPQQRWQGWQNALEARIIAHDLARAYP